MATTRCKFTVSSIMLNKSARTIYDDEGKYVSSEPFTLPTVSLTAVKDEDPNSENGKFWEASPAGSINLTINNPLGAEVFEVGKDYYVDFTLA